MRSPLIYKKIPVSVGSFILSKVTNINKWAKNGQSRLYPDGLNYS